MTHNRPIVESLQEYGRGLAGGLLFSLPLLYTMEVWFTGFIAAPWRLLVYLAATFALLLGYNNYAGIRHDSDWTDVVVDSFEELGLGLVTATGLLMLLGRLDASQSWREIIGKIVVEAGIVAIGFSVGTAQLGTGENEQEGRGSETAASVSSQAVIALCGAVLFAVNIAPTEEVKVIALEVGPTRLMLIMALSAALGLMILYFSSFARSEKFSKMESKSQAFTGGVITYGIALMSSAAMLWFFGRFDGCSVELAVAQIVVLGLPATLGASAGRLLLQS